MKASPEFYAFNSNWSQSAYYVTHYNRHTRRLCTLIRSTKDQAMSYRASYHCSNVTEYQQQQTVRFSWACMYYHPTLSIPLYLSLLCLAVYVNGFWLVAMPAPRLSKLFKWYDLIFVTHPPIHTQTRGTLHPHNHLEYSRPRPMSFPVTGVPVMDQKSTRGPFKMQSTRNLKRTGFS